MKIRSLLLIAALALSPVAALAQGFTLPTGSTIAGHQFVAGGQPTATGATMAVGSTNFAGRFTASAASGSIVWAGAITLPRAPFCIVSDQSATPLAVYVSTATGITLTTLTSGHIYNYHCVGALN